MTPNPNSLSDKVRRRVTRALIPLKPDSILVGTVMTFIMNRVGRKWGTHVHFAPDAFEIIKGDDVMRIKLNLWVYGLTLSKEFESFFKTVVPTRIGSKNVIDFSKGGLQKFRQSGLEFEISGLPEEEDTVQDYFFWYKPQPGETVFDLGSNCGLSVYYFSQCVGPAGKVYAFEPDPINFGVLQRNIQRHKLDNVVPLQKAVAGASGSMQFFSEGTVGSILASESSRPTVGNVVNVETLTLEDACKQYGMPTYIKMDIEGAEIEAIAAARTFLKTNPINFSIDTGHWKDGKLTTGPVEELFKQCGYETLSREEAGYITTWARKQ